VSIESLIGVGHPALQKHALERAKSIQNRVADAITAFAGSMNFVYVHVALFTLWMLFLEEKPWPTLTLVVSLEAIFLSTFILISQNRADQKRAVLATEEWRSVQLEEKQNEQLLNLSQQILALSESIHELTEAHTGIKGSVPPGAQAPPTPEPDPTTAE